MKGDNPHITPLLRWVTVLESAVLVVSGGGLFFFPTLFDSSWPWELTPFNARLLGAIYLASLVSTVFVVLRNHWSPARVVVPMIFMFTVIVLIVSLVYIEQFTVLFSTALWFILYIGIPLNAVYHLWLYRSLPSPQPTKTSSALRLLMRLQAAGLGLYGIGMLIAPAFFTQFWFWSIDAFHGRMYSVAFLAPAVGAWILAQSATRTDLQALGWTQVAGGLLPIVAMMIVDATVSPERRIDWAQEGTWLWFALFAAIFVMGALMLWQAQKDMPDETRT